MKEKKWLTLSDVADMLGIHPSTVRSWADQGILPVYRTKGGHRRFMENEIKLWLQTSRQKPSVEPSHALQDVMKHIRLKIVETKLASEPWYQKLDEDARDLYRMSGSVIVQSLASYLTAAEEDALAEARSLGYEYASRGRRHGLSLVDATRAFLFFRNTLLEAMFAVYLNARVSDTEAWGDMLTRVHAFTDQTMLSLMETYEAFEAKHQ